MSPGESPSAPSQSRSKPETVRERRAALVTGLAAGLVFALGLVLSFPPFNVWPATILMPLAATWAAWRGRWGRTRWWGGTAAGVVFGTIPGWGFEHAWIFNVSELGYFPLVLLNAAFIGLYVALAARVFRRWPRAPFVLGAVAFWPLIEIFRGDVFGGGYPWYLAAHPLIAVSPLAAAGSVTGAYGVSMLLAAFAGAALDVALRRRVMWGIAGAIGAVLAWAACSVAPTTAVAGSVRIGIVQTNSQQDNRTPTTPYEMVELMQRLGTLTREAASQGPELIAWPESMMPGRTMDPASIQEEIAERIYYVVTLPNGRELELNAWEFAEATLALQHEVGIPFLVGAEAFENLSISVTRERGVEYLADHTYNSVFLLRDGEVAPQRYDKIHLTPFGETMPGIRHWPWLQARLIALGAYGMSFDLTPGSQRTAFEVPRAGDGAPLRVVTPICFEATVPALCRRMVYAPRAARRADILVNGTNDGWFNAFPRGREQHFQAARWRAVELGTPMARAANTGVSALVDHRGRVIARGVHGDPVGIGVDGVLVGDLPMVEGATLYARGGWLVPWLAAAAGLLWVLLALLKPRSVRTSESLPGA